MRSPIGVLGLSLLTALGALADTPGRALAGPPAVAPIDSACASPLRFLLEHQRPDGSFGDTDARLQTTAFVSIALADDRAVPRTADVRRALRRATEFLVSKQADSGAFVEDGADHTVLALLALVALRDGSAAEPPPSDLARAALRLMPRELSEAILDARVDRDDASLVRAAWALARRE